MSVYDDASTTRTTRRRRVQDLGDVITIDSSDESEDESVDAFESRYSATPPVATAIDGWQEEEEESSMMKKQPTSSAARTVGVMAFIAATTLAHWTYYYHADVLVGYLYL